MSDTITAFDHGTALAGWARRATEMYAKDLRHMSPESIANSRGGATRSVAGITADAAWLADCVAAMVRGETPATTDYATHVEWIPNLNSIDACVECITNAGNALAEAIENLPAEKFGEEITAPWGAPTTLYSLAATAANHIWYHDGQLNYIQALDGDGDVHWM